MPYIGNNPEASFANIEYQDLTGQSGTSFTLDHSVSTATELEVFINNVRQEPFAEYTASGTTLTIKQGTVASTDDFYIVFQGKAVSSVAQKEANATFDSITVNSGITNLVRFQTFTADGTYTPSTGATKALVYATGAGGGGGGTNGGSSAAVGGAQGGGGGATAMKFISPLASSYTVTVGSGGTGGSAGNNNGSAGGNTTFTDGASLTLTANGGAGGSGIDTSDFEHVGRGTVPATATGGDINYAGGRGGGFRNGDGTSDRQDAIGGFGGSSFFGEGAEESFEDINSNVDNGKNASSKGGGGSGGCAKGASDSAGGNGAGGIVVIFEYL